MIFMPGDMVQYVGQKYKGKLADKVGTVHSRIRGIDNSVVVDFPYKNKEGDEEIDSFLLDERFCLIPAK